jgi:hypothetical protein
LKGGVQGSPLAWLTGNLLVPMAGLVQSPRPARYIARLLTNGSFVPLSRNSLPRTPTVSSSPVEMRATLSFLFIAVLALAFTAEAATYVGCLDEKDTFPTDKCSEVSNVNKNDDCVVCRSPMSLRGADRNSRPLARPTNRASHRTVTRSSSGARRR